MSSSESGPTSLDKVVDDASSPSGVGLLPPEVLLRIFHHSCADGRDRITFVCRHWRQLAIDCPSIWTRLVNPTLKVARCCIARSGDSPLSVRFGAQDYFPFTIDEDALPLVLMQWHRIRSLDIMFIGDSLCGHLLEVIGNPTPALEQLRIAGGYENDFGFIPPAAPNLRELELVATHFPRGVDIPPGLKMRSLCLNVLTTRFIGSEYILGGLLAILDEMPTLQSLSIIGMLRTDMADFDPPPIELPELRYVAIEAKSPNVALWFMKKLYVPDGLRVFLETQAQEPHIAADVNVCFSMLQGWTLRAGQTYKIILGYTRSTFSFRLVHETQTNEPTVELLHITDVRTQSARETLLEALKACLGYLAVLKLDIELELGQRTMDPGFIAQFVKDLLPFVMVLTIKETSTMGPMRKSRLWMLPQLAALPGWRSGSVMPLLSSLTLRINKPLASEEEILLLRQRPLRKVYLTGTHGVGAEILAQLHDCAEEFEYYHDRARRFWP